VVITRISVIYFAICGAKQIRTDEYRAVGTESKADFIIAAIYSKHTVKDRISVACGLRAVLIAALAVVVAAFYRSRNV
jgi:hypothetical protein